MKLFPYGFHFNLTRDGIWMMLNGRMFSFFRSLHTGKWQFSTWANWWRRNKIALGSFVPDSLLVKGASK